MLKYLKSLDWHDLAASAFVLASLFVIFSPSAFEPNQKQADHGGSYTAASNRDQSSPEERLADYTLGLEWFTAALVATALFEIWMLLRADATSRNLISINQQQMLLAGRQADILEKQKEIARLEFFATHRPRMRIWLMRLQPPQHGHPISVHLEVTNFGESEATSVELNATIEVMIAGAEPRFDATDHHLGDILGIGYGKVVKITAASLHYDTAWEESGCQIAIRGRIKYRDAVGHGIRFTGFDRTYDPTTRRFVVSSGSEYEFET
jgi:hypothetical protein